MILHERIRTVLRSDPARPVMEFGGRCHAMGEFGALADQLDAMLSRRGIGAATRIGLVARNRPLLVGAFATLLATQRCSVMIYSAQSNAAIADDIRRLRLPAVIADSEDWTEATIAAAREAGTLGLALTANVHEVAPYQNAPHHEVDVVRFADREVAMELLSSGTTGAPKRIALSMSTYEQAVADSAATYAADGSRDAYSPNVVFHPLGNVAGVTFLIPFVTAGHPVALLERFHLKDWLAAVRRHRPARVSLPPAVLRTLLDEKVSVSDLASLVAIGVGAAPLDPELQEQFETAYRIPLLAGYGATEFCGVIANWTLDLHREFGRPKRGSVGRPRPGVSLRIVDAQDGAEAQTGAVGLLEARVLRMGDDWIRTTDLASVDADGFLYLHGRADDAINRGGFKVLAEPVAHVLRQHPSVADAAVIGLADARLGQIPVAAVELRAAAPALDEQELATFARQHLAAYQVPARFLILKALPRNPSMKVSLPELQRLFASAPAEPGSDASSLPAH